MKKQDVIRAWREGEFFDNLSDAQRATLPASPAASITLDDDALKGITGGCGGATSAICSPCPPYICH